MLKLMQLELKKFHLAGYIRSALIANACIFGLFIIIALDSQSEGVPEFTGYAELLDLLDYMVRATFIIFASVLLCRFIVSEFKSKSINILFMYPIDRKKLMVAKLLVVLLFTFLSIILSEIIITAALHLLNQFVVIVPDKLSLTILGQQSVRTLINAVAASFMGLVPLYMGMRKYSIPTTIVSSILIVALLFSNNNGATLSSIALVQIGFAVLGMLVAYAAIRRIEYNDITS
ncbi:ABC-type transport system involved in multi-copper enzyme maturation permease subunit [Paenibacillus sp. RC254]|uniref:ABC transporter permease n=1 Tax=unclassified Paenibacillus TaxID=185978 RepID=UPI0024BA5FBD|nr:MULTISPECIES: ABC transporter permease [unclassified Paenibacillus]